jgi:hypothetical protein
VARKQLESWGGEVHLPRWLRRRRAQAPADTPEKLAEGARERERERTVIENADRAMGAFGLSGAMYKEGEHRHDK